MDLGTQRGMIEIAADLAGVERAITVLGELERAATAFRGGSGRSGDRTMLAVENVESGVGELTGDERLWSEGELDQARGGVEDGVG